MKKRIKTIRRSVLCLLLCLALLPLCPPLAAAEDGRTDFSSQTLGEAIESYLEKHSIGANSISIGWQDIESGEEWYHNPDLFMEGASTYKLPLAMIYADRIAAGELTLDDRFGSYRLEDALRVMLEDSNNAAGKLLRDGLSTNYAEYRRMLAGPSGLDPDSLPRTYFSVNSFSARFLIIITLSSTSEQYRSIISWLLCPGIRSRSL